MVKAGRGCQWNATLSYSALYIRISPRSVNPSFHMPSCNHNNRVGIVNRHWLMAVIIVTYHCIHTSGNSRCNGGYCTTQITTCCDPVTIYYTLDLYGVYTSTHSMLVVTPSQPRGTCRFAVPERVRPAWSLAVALRCCVVPAPSTNRNPIRLIPNETLTRRLSCRQAGEPVVFRTLR